MVDHTHPRLGDRTNWILRILYTPARDNTAVPIIGNTRLMKACFLTHRTLSSEFSIETDFQFHPDDYGPLDPLVYDTVEYLEEEGLIETSQSARYNGTEYSLTSDGMEDAQQLFEDLAPEVREHMEWLKTKHILKSLSKLLSFVYNQYPDMAENSTIA